MLVADLQLAPLDLSLFSSGQHATNLVAGLTALLLSETQTEIRQAQIIYNELPRRYLFQCQWQ